MTDVFPDPAKNTFHTVAVIGGSGFLGRYVVARLAKAGYRVTVGGRDALSALHLKMASAPGMITLHAMDVRCAEDIAHFIQGCDVVINLVGLLYEHGHQRFDVVHTQAARAICRAVTDYNVKRYIHISALGVTEPHASQYIKTKKLAEDHILTSCDHAFIVRPSLIFGAEDQFFNRFARMIRLSPFIPVFKGGHTRFQPVYVDDVAQGICALLQKDMGPKSNTDRIYECVGPKVYSFQELLEILMHTMNCHRPIVSLPDMMAYLTCAVSSILPKPLLTYDQFKMLNIDSIATHKHPSLSSLGIATHSLEQILPRYIHATHPK